jgi:hypothetical protein
VAILGPTATGKSALGIALALRFGGEIVSCDSTAVYRGFDIGTDKVPVAERRGIPHHLIDVASPMEEYSAARYAREAALAIGIMIEGACRSLAEAGSLPGADRGFSPTSRDNELSLTGTHGSPGRIPALRLQRVDRRRPSASRAVTASG